MTIEAPPAPAGMRLLTVGAGLWRAVDRTGRAVGHLRREDGADGARFRALRFHAPSRDFRTVGEFSSPRDAIDSLRYGG